MKWMSLFTNNKDKIYQVANKINNAENETLKRLAKNRTTQDSRDIVKKWNEIHKDKPMFVMEWWKDIKKQTWNIIFTEAANPVKIDQALKWLFENPDIKYEIDYSWCKNQAIKEKMLRKISKRKCYLWYNKEQKTYTILDENENLISDRAYIWEWVKLIPAWVRQRNAHIKQKKQNEDIWKLNNFELDELTYSMQKDIPSAKELKQEEKKELVKKTENRIINLLKKAKNLWYELEPECITKKWLWKWHVELHLNSWSSEVDWPIWENDESYNETLGEKLDNFIDSNISEYIKYLTKRVKTKRQELDTLTKTETTNLDKKWQQNLSDKEKEQAELHKIQVLYGIWLLEKMVDNYRETEWDSRDNDDRDLIQIKKLIRNAKASINNSNNLDDEAIIKNFINPIWRKWASIKRITRNTNIWQGQIYENHAYKEQYNQLKNVFLWEKNQQISAIRSLWWNGCLTRFLAEETNWNNNSWGKEPEVQEWQSHQYEEDILNIDNKNFYEWYNYTQEEIESHHHYKRWRIIEKIQTYTQNFIKENRNITKNEIINAIRPDLVTLPKNEKKDILTWIDRVASKFNTIRKYLDFKNWPYIKKYPNAKALLCAMRGITNSDVIKNITNDITVIQHWVWLTFFVWDEKSYNWIYNIVSEKDTWSWWFNNRSSCIKDLEWTLSVVNWKDPWNDKDQYIYWTIRHEWQHNRNSYFMPDKVYKEPITRAKDEITAFLRDWRWIFKEEKWGDTIQNILTRDGWLYQYNLEWTERENHKKKVWKLLEYADDLINATKDKNIWLTRKNIISLLSDTPYERWKEIHSNIINAIKTHNTSLLKEKYWWTWTAEKQKEIDEINLANTIDEIKYILKNPKYSHISWAPNNRWWIEISAIIDNVIEWELSTKYIPREIREKVQKIMIKQSN